MNLRLSPVSEPDGELRCRTDSTGLRIALLPATCKRGVHVLTLAEGWMVAQDGEIHIVCTGCASVPGADGHWRLTVTGPNPVRAELDHELYRGLIRDDKSA
ncbi:hypothetical protein [Kutzneria albida]|uniref:Uncharacterized protein n=1 Tax=Kutzneria albida DSM 43870 TaxID=1449976 RepID=W5WBV3_9PSEU|nr:hypothetical protein [Kutzneria albida]AHH98623.1 hypothetical protein KALB_5261 [Kutzneria albida DSM 43870]